MNQVARASLKYATISQQKLGVIAKMMRGKKADKTMTLLSFLPKKGAKIMKKVLRSAIANAEQKKIKKEDLIIDIVDVGVGPSLKRMRFVGRARIYGYKKHRSFVRIVLATK